LRRSITQDEEEQPA